MTAAELFDELRTVGVALRVEDERLVCDAPKGVLTEQLRAQITAQKQALIELVRMAGARAVGADPIPRVSKDELLALSLAQRRLWFSYERLRHLHKGRPPALFNLPLAFRLKGELAVDALRAAFENVAARHDVLRTEIVERDGVPMQRVNSASTIEFNVIEVDAKSPIEREARVLQYLEERVRQPLNPGGALFCAELFRLDHDLHVLLMLASQLIFDGASWDVLLRELDLSYSALSDHQAVPVLPPPLQYADFAAWQEKRAKSMVDDERLRACRGRLTGELPLLELPGDRVRPAAMSHRGGIESITLRSELLDAVERLARREGASPFIALLSAFEVLLHRWSGQDDLIVAAPVAARFHPELETAIGFFANLMVIRTRIEPDTTFRDLLLRVRDAVLEAHEYQDIPLEYLFDGLEIDADPSHTAPYQASFSYLDLSHRVQRIGNLELSPIDLHNGTCTTDIVLWAHKHRDHTHVGIDYNLDVFDGATVRSFLAGIVRVLEESTRDPMAPIGRIPVAGTPATMDPESVARPFVALHRAILAKARKWPDRIALVTENGHVSYGDLERRARVIAGALVATGLRAGDGVGIALSRGIDLVATMLATAMIGAHWVPVGWCPTPECMAEIARETRVGTIVVDHDGILVEGITSIDVRRTAPDGDLADALIPVDDEGPKAHACVAFGDACDGNRVAVWIDHDELATTGWRLGVALGRHDDARFMTLAPFESRCGAVELLAPLAAGFAVVLVPDAAAPPSAVEDLGVTHLVCGSIDAVDWIAASKNEQCGPKLRCIVVRGEPLSATNYRRLRELADDVVYVHGCSSTGSWFLSHRVADSDCDPVLGEPLPGVGVTLVDEHGEPVIDGMIGELWVHTSSATSDGPIRTGDLARRNGKGQLIFRGRKADLFRVRGCVIDAVGPELVLQEHPAIARAVLVPQDREGLAPVLVAHLETLPHHLIEVSEFRRWLQARLSPVVVPHTFRVVSRLPGAEDRERVERDALRSERLATPVGTALHPWKAVWVPTDPLPPLPACGDRVLVFTDDTGLGAQLVHQLRGEGRDVVTVRSGDAFCREDDRRFQLNPEHGEEGYCALLTSLAGEARVPDIVVHLWSVTREVTWRPGSSFFHRSQDYGLLSVLALGRAWREVLSHAPLRMTVAVNGVFQVGSEPVIHADKATVVGAAKALMAELDDCTVKLVDFALPAEQTHWSKLRRMAASIGWRRRLAKGLRAELTASEDLVVAYRIDDRFRLQYDGIHLDIPKDAAASDEPGGTYVVTGGLREPGLIAAAALCSGGPVRLVLVDETSLPPREQWHDWSRRNGPDDAMTAAIRAIRGLEENGAQVVVAAADITDRESLRGVVGRICGEHGPIRGVIHAPFCGSAVVHRDRLDAQITDDRFAAMVHGSRVVADVFGPVDFFAVIGPHDPMDCLVDAGTAAAQAYVSAFVRQRRATSGRRHFCLWYPDLGPARQQVIAALTHALRQPLGAELLLTEHEIDGAAMQTVAKRPRGRVIEVAPKDATEAALLDLWREALSSETLGLHDDFFEAGGTSLVAARLFSRLHERLGVELPLSALFRAPTAAQCAALIRETVVADETDSPSHGPRAAAGSHLVLLHPGGGGGHPLFLAAGAFGNVLNLRHLAQLVGRDRPVYGIQAKGLLGADAPHQTFEEMAADYLREMRSVQPMGPYLVGGFCSGGIAAFEMAQQLTRQGEQVPLVVMLDTSLPTWDDHVTWGDRIRIQMQRLRRQGLAYFADWAKQRLSWELGRLRARVKIVSHDDSIAVFRSSMIFEHTQRAMLHYQPQPYRGEVLLLRPPFHTVYELKNGRRVNEWREFIYDDLGWSRWVDRLQVEEVAGDHDSFVLEPCVRGLASRIRAALAVVDRAAGLQGHGRQDPA